MLTTTDLAFRLTPEPLKLRITRIHARRRAELGRSGRIFGIGLSRTATTSLNSALGTLGFASVHFPADSRSREQIGGFLAAATPSEPLRLSVLRRVDALTDTPASATFEALDKAYPRSKFILTVRDKSDWLESCRSYWANTVEPFLAVHDGDGQARYVEALCKHLYGTVEFDRGSFSRGYDEYHDRVKAHFAGRPDDLLALDLCAGDGWASLCRILGQPVPATTFPWRNAGATRAMT